MKHVQLVFLLLGTVICIGVGTESGWSFGIIPTWPSALWFIGAFVGMMFGIWHQYRILVDMGHDEAKRAWNPDPARDEHRHQMKRRALPEEVVDVIEQLLTYAEESQANAAAAVAAGKIAIENMWGLDRHVAEVKHERDELRDHGARLDADLNAIAQVVERRTGAPVPMAPLRRSFDGRASEPTLDEPRVVMKPRPIEDDPVPAFLTKPRVDLSELEEAINGTQGRE